MEWSLISGGASAFGEVKNITLAEGWRLPTAEELVAAVNEATATLRINDVNVDSPVWACDGSAVDATAESVISGPGICDKAVFVVVRERKPVRPTQRRKRTLTVMGFLDEAVFQQCVEAAAYLNSEHSEEYTVRVEKMMGHQYERRREELAALPSAGDDVATARVLVHDTVTNDLQIGEKFVSQVTTDTDFKVFDLPDDDPQSYQALARKCLRNFLGTTGCSFAWMLVKIDDMVAGRVVFQLNSTACPKTCQNFLHLCRGDLPDATLANGEKLPLTYKGSTIFRVVKNGWIQGGDVTGKKTGNGGHSIYGRYFPDESFDIPHDDAGVLGMANDGEHTNSSSFYITVKKSSWMNKRYVAFGRVVEGLNVVHAIHNIETYHNQTPKKKIVIEDCGHVALE